MKTRFEKIKEWYHYRFYWSDLMLPVMIIGLLILLVGAMYCSAEKKNRLMLQCLNDGFKEYQCEGMIEGQAPTPIVIPVRTR